MGICTSRPNESEVNPHDIFDLSTLATICPSTSPPKCKYDPLTRVFVISVYHVSPEETLEYFQQIIPGLRYHGIEVRVEVESPVPITNARIPTLRSQSSSYL